LQIYERKSPSWSLIRMSTCSVEQPGPSVLSVALTLLAGSLVIAGISYLVLIGSEVAQNAPKLLQDPSQKFIIGPSDFWYKRWTFWKRAMASAKGNFMFTVGQYTAVGMVSDSAIAAHYDHRDLDFSSGCVSLERCLLTRCNGIVY